MRTFENFSFSKFVLFQIFLIWVFLFFYNENNKKDFIRADVIEYYSYLPATFICNNVTVTELDNNKCNGRYWFVKTKDGKKLFKMTMGMAFMYSPFFLIAHNIAPLLNDPQDGYSSTYQSLLAYSSIFYLMLGLFYLRKLLLNFYSDKISAAVIVCLFFGTNLFCYSTCEGEFLMAHSYLFSLTCFIMYFTKKLYEKLTLKLFFLLGFLIGLASLIRPTNSIVILIPLLYGIRDIEGLKNRISVLTKAAKNISIFSLGFLLPIIPQLIYWQAMTGHWIFYSYLDNSFYFLSPHLIDGLFGFRKGLFVYTPILCIVLLGFFRLKKFAGDFFLSTAIIVPVFTYVTLSWWCWWYGGSFGGRPFVDLYPLFALPLGGVLNYIFTRTNFIKGVAIIILEILIVLNLFQTWQFKQGILHYDSMTKESYIAIFGRRNYPTDYLSLINEPDVERIYAGLHEQLSVQDFHSIKLYLKSKDFKYLSCDLALNAKILGNKADRTDIELFSIEENGNSRRFSIKAINGNYLKVEDNGEISASSNSVSNEAIFKIDVLEKTGWITIRTLNNKYLEINESDKVLKLGSDSLTEACKFKVFTASSPDGDRWIKRQQRLKYYKELIMNTPEWLGRMRNYALEKKCTLDTEIAANALYMVGQEKPQVE